MLETQILTVRLLRFTIIQINRVGSLNQHVLPLPIPVRAANTNLDLVDLWHSITVQLTAQICSKDRCVGSRF